MEVLNTHDGEFIHYLDRANIDKLELSNFVVFEADIGTSAGLLHQISSQLAGEPTSNWGKVVDAIVSLSEHAQGLCFILTYKNNEVEFLVDCLSILSVCYAPWRQRCKPFHLVVTR